MIFVTDISFPIDEINVSLKYMVHIILFQLMTCPEFFYKKKLQLTWKEYK